MELRVVAVAAPEYPEGRLGKGTLTSQDPASLFNAARYAAQLSELKSGAWSTCNWSTGRTQRRNTVLMMHSLKEDLPAFDHALHTVKPNLLLIGAMSMCLPGAIACAQHAREVLGDQVCIVLGGRHATEAIYSDHSGRKIVHHPGSPLRLMAEGLIPSVFDFVISGDGEYIIAALGEAIAAQPGPFLVPARILLSAPQLQRASGNWILGMARLGSIAILRGCGTVLDRNLLAPPCAMFGVRNSFDIFNGRLTAHVFSDTGPGCPFDCNFCSERRSVTGTPAQINSAARRLYRQFDAATQVIAADSPGFGASAFVEDSVLLAGSTREFRNLIDLLSEKPLDLKFGAQLTIDQILAKADLLSELSQLGLKYLFIGIETLDPSSIGGMSKDTQAKAWSERIELAFEILAQRGINCGAALLFGLGETVHHRTKLFEYLARWRKTYGFPNPISMNWGVQHPLRGHDGGMNYDYRHWGVPVGGYLEAFHNFGEASVLYPLSGQKPPVLEEVWEVERMYAQLNAESSRMPAPGAVHLHSYEEAPMKAFARVNS